MSLNYSDNISDYIKFLKEKIFADNKIEYILSELNCTNIKHEQNGILITAQLPDEFDSRNNRAVQVKLSDKLISFVRNKDITGDIFNIIQFILDCDLIQSINWICNVLNYYEDIQNFIPKVNYLKKWQALKHKRNKNYYELLNTNTILPETTLIQYANIPSYEWYKQGLSYTTQREFEVMLDNSGDITKIVFPVRGEDGSLLSVKARVSQQHSNICQDKKYYYLYPYNRSLNIYNHQQCKSHVAASNRVYVFESEKSVMLASQWGVKNSISTQGNQITPVQIRKLLNLDCSIYFVFDKDITLEFFDKYKSQLLNRKSFVIVDSNDLFTEKDSPTDKGIDMFKALLTNPDNKIKLT